MITDEEIRKVIAPLLLSGAKMLDKHCPKCGSPLFEKDGRVFCPVCEYREKKRERELKGVEEVLMEKFKELANSMPTEVEKLRVHLEVMEKLLTIIERYKKLEGGK
ncbi:hypothetical protein A3L04_09830 [Thermococcus chitonophagus]|uniref:UPF0148 protein A3L04_09830 n=1 Tax=Thermococcus chitonophagus TaxID=54262 RepID=A0A160VVW7_9EURY|nr:Sjogren's syndrome/scleroderma autoantigen 1 family protein [Thermococcus chitonophagus]ASJ17346.1 hypothetical protein A3L04_09830 [Thermococcus chitonophagus]CUX77981.1 hypothetical protein CHITON_1202 [Thermococcus chitonophagus]